MCRYDSLDRDELIHLLREADSLLQASTADNAQRLLHDLQLHKIELEIQNRDLRESQQSLEETRNRYAELYDFAPVGYLSLDRNGMIGHLNLTAAALLGKPRTQLLGTPLSTALAAGTSDRLFRHLRQAFDSDQVIVGELALRGNDAEMPREYRLDSQVRADADGHRRCLTALSDISESRRLARELHASHAELSSLLAAAPVGIGLVRERVFQWVSPHVLEMLGYAEAELLGHSTRILYSDDTEFERVGREKYAQIHATGIGEVETRVRHRDGRLLDVLLRSATLERDNPAAGIIFTMLDISARKRTEQHLRLARNVLDNTPEGVMVTDPTLRIIDVNPAFTNTTGYTRDQTLGRRPDMLKSGRHDNAFYQQMWNALECEGKWEGEIWNRRKNGDIYPEWLSINRLTNDTGITTNYVGLFTDITSQAHIRERLHRLAYYDPLTELPNRELFRDRFTLLAQQAQRHAGCVALLYLDLDDFKQVNDTLGHPAGDTLLQETARRLSHCVRESDVVARLGGDEFTIVMPEIDCPANVETLATKMLEAFAKPFTLAEREFFITASIGISVFPDDGKDIDTLIMQADAAMYQAKQAGRNTYRFFRMEFAEKSRERVRLSGYLHRAVENNELEVHYQPQILLRHGSLCGVEALARWHHPQMGSISPATFIPIAEQSGLIVELSDWIIRRAIAEWSAHFQQVSRGRPPRLCVNLSTVQCHKQDVHAYIVGVLTTTGMDPHYLELEITESALMYDPDKTAAQLAALADLGVRIAIDDFGTGYSSLSYLARFPINTVKIDRSFVRDLLGNAKHTALISTIIDMGRTLDFDVVVEGVENIAQLAMLEELGCDQVQGFVFSRPHPAAEIACWQAARESRA